MPSNGFFTYDAGLVKDGCFFAGFMLAQGDFEDEGHSLELGMDVEDGVDICLHALGSLEWVFSKSDGRQQIVRMMWEARNMREAEHRMSRRMPEVSTICNGVGAMIDLLSITVYGTWTIIPRIYQDFFKPVPRNLPVHKYCQPELLFAGFAECVNILCTAHFVHRHRKLANVCLS